MVDICSGWKQQSFKSIVSKITLNGNRPLPLIYTSVDGMSGLSGKKELLQKIFNHLNHRKLDRIDAMEFTATILICIDDHYDQMIHNVVYIFGFSAGSTSKTITVEEFFFFLDCLFRGIMSFVSTPNLIFNKL